MIGMYGRSQMRIRYRRGPDRKSEPLRLATRREVSVDLLDDRAGRRIFARKIAVILHCVWVDGTPFDWGQAKEA